MSRIFDKHLLFEKWNNPYFVLEFIKALSFLSFSIIINYYAVRYATLNAGPPIPDTILDNIPLFNTAYIDYYLALYIQYGVLLFALTQVKQFIFFIQGLSLLIIVRSFFVNLTQLGIPEGAVPTTSFFTQGGDLFFSGHTALPFFAALVFWDLPLVRYIFLGLSLFFGVEVLLGHQHYSIDVFAAPFITYGVFCFLKKIL